MIKDSFVYLIFKIVPSIFNVLTIMIFTRLLTKEEYGFYSIILTSVIFLNGLLFQWIRISVVRMYGKYKKQKNFLINNANTLLMYIYIILVLLSIILLVILNFWGKINLGIMKYWILISIFTIIQSNYDLYINLQRAKIKPISYGIYNTVQSILSFSFAIILFVTFNDIYYLLIGLMLGYLVPTLILLGKENIKFSWKLNKLLIGEIFKYGLPLIITLSITLIMHSTDRFMLLFFKGSVEVAEYSATYNITQQTMLFFMSILNLAAFPRIIKSYEEKGDLEARNTMTQYFNVFFVLMIPALIGAIVLSEDIVLLILGESYQNVADYLLPILLVSVFIQGVKLYYFDMSFHIAGKTKLQSYSVILGLLINIILNYFLIPVYGTVGAAAATFFSSIVSLLIGIRLGKSSFKVAFDKLLVIKITLSSLIMGIVIYSIPSKQLILGLTLKIIIGIVLYFSVLYLLDYKFVRNIIKKVKRGD